MDALDLLIQQHDEVDELIADLDATDDADARCQLFEELADKLAAHARIEEELFYPAVMLGGEHLGIKRVLAELVDLDTEDEDFDAKLAVMKEQIAHHAHEEEETQLFPKVERLLTRFEREALGQAMLVRYLELLDDEPRFDMPAAEAVATF